MGADYIEKDFKEGVPPIGIGKDCYISNAIVDKNARIGDGAYISPDNLPNGTETRDYAVKDGVIVIRKGAVIPPGTKL